MNIQNEIQGFLNSSYFTNTNHREQNLQGRLYAYLLHLEKEGYVVEMESNIVKSNDYKDLFGDPDLRKDLIKSEVDILIYKKKGNEFVEAYAIELKWFYDPGFHYFDNYKEFVKDVAFVQQLRSGNTRFTETAALTFVESLNTKAQPNRMLYKDYLAPMEYSPNHKQCSFVSDPDGIIVNPPVQFTWNDNLQINNTPILYYLITF